ncbi:MAG: thioredoxin family protein [Victivallaceae bacterium]
MKKATLLLIAAIFSGILTLQAVPPNSGWFTSLPAAQKVAKAGNKKIYALFTGSDWCPYCVKLEKDVLKQKKFDEFAKDKLVLLYLDFPRGRKLPAKESEANRALYEKYGVEGFPTAVILDSEGNAIDKIVGPNPVEDYLKRLQAALDKGNAK